VSRVAFAVLAMMIFAAATSPAMALTSSTATKTVALWHMDELSGTTMVDSGTSPANDGTLTNVTVGVPGINGTTGYGFTRGYVSVPSQSSLNPGSANLTVTISANPSSLPTSGDFDVIRKGDSPAQQYKMEILQSGALTCGFRGSIKSATVTSTATMAANTGYHTLKCIKTTYQIKASLDGVVTALNSKVGSISSSSPVVIGAHGNGTYDFYKGSLDEASIATG
jgi:acetyl/propionyl-CoA carboxylase alpha subunit